MGARAVCKGGWKEQGCLHKVPSQGSRRAECRLLAASHLVSKKRGCCSLIGKIGNTLVSTHCRTPWWALGAEHPGANSAKLRPKVENFGSVFAKSQRSWAGKLVGPQNLTWPKLFFGRMLTPAGEREVCRAWEGFQCGFCGAEFRTKPELKQHQFSKHGTTRPLGPQAGSN